MPYGGSFSLSFGQKEFRIGYAFIPWSNILGNIVGID